MRLPPNRPCRSGTVVALVISCVSLNAIAIVKAGVAASTQLFRTRIDLIYVTATVRDDTGRLIGDLNLDDFEVSEDGYPQRITHFSRERVPVSLGLVLDVSDSMRGDRIQDARLALASFLESLLMPGDEAFLISFNHRPTLVAPWTSNLAGLTDHLDTVQPFGGTAIYDAVLDALPMLGGRRHQRAALLVLSDGADTASDSDLRAVRNRLRESDATVYAIAIDGARRTRLNDTVNPYTLREMTDESGGYTELVHDSEELSPATGRIAEELNHQYILAYTPSRPLDGRYRRIRVKVVGHDYLVRARRGYVASVGRR